MPPPTFQNHIIVRFAFVLSASLLCFGCTRNKVWGVYPREQTTRGPDDGVRTGVQASCDPERQALTPPVLATLEEGRPVDIASPQKGSPLGLTGDLGQAPAQNPEQSFTFELGSEPLRTMQVFIQAQPQIDGTKAQGIEVYVRGANMTASAKQTTSGEFGNEVALTVNTLPGLEADTGRFNQGKYVRFVTLPSPATRVQVRVVGIPSRELKAVKVFAEKPMNTNNKLDLSDAGNPYKPPGFAKVPRGFTLIPRSAWTSRTPKSSPDTTVWKHIVVHHSADKVASPSECESHLRGYLTSHMDGNGWNDIGYGFLVCPDGRVFEGRKGGKNTQGAQTIYVNEFTVGVNFMGQFHSPAASALGLNRPTAQQLDSGAKLIAWLATESNIDLSASASLKSMRPDLKVPSLTFHRFLAEGTPETDDGTACPGDLLIKEVAGLRQKAIQYKNDGVFEGAVANVGAPAPGPFNAGKTGQGEVGQATLPSEPLQPCVVQ